MSSEKAVQAEREIRAILEKHNISLVASRSGEITLVDSTSGRRNSPTMYQDDNGVVGWIHPD